MQDTTLTTRDSNRGSTPFGNLTISQRRYSLAAFLFDSLGWHVGKAGLWESTSTQSGQAHFAPNQCIFMGRPCSVYMSSFKFLVSFFMD